LVARPVCRRIRCAHLEEPQVHDLLGTDHITSEIIYAYPFTSQATEHRIAVRSAVQVLCAIDALGIGGAFQTDVAITSSRRFCQTPINISTANAGRVISTVTPDDTVVWYDLSYAGAAATSCCLPLSSSDRDV
jgi:hypothetical protein